MRNEVPDDHGSVAHRRNRRRKQAIAGVAGLAVLGAGAYLVTSQVVDNTRTKTKDAAALAPAPLEPVSPSASEPASAEPSAAASASASPSTAATPEPSPAPSRTLTAEQRVAKARAAASKAGYPVKRGLVPTAKVAAGPVSVRNTGSLQQGGTMRIVSAPYDLTGTRELLWAADEGNPAGDDVRCTQNFKLSNDTEARVRPTMLLCWRTSAGKSVVTVAVARKGKPASAASVAVIDREWAKIG